MDEERFRKPVIETVAKRAANTCSNPDCQAITAGPAEEPDRAVNVGEAAHIYGAHPGSARYDPAMTDASRGDSTNAIWLCRTCHKIVDDDPGQYPAELLFEWRREHERAAAARVGKTGAALREKISKRLLEPFERSSYLAQQIVLDKPPLWEYKLTSELLRTMAGPFISRWRSLKRGLYTKPVQVIPGDSAFSWIQARINEMEGFGSAIEGLVNGEFQASWGPPGQPGSETEILRVCGLFAECCERLLIWEETVRFSTVPRPYGRVLRALSGAAGHMLEEIARLPAHFEEVFSQEDPEGEYHLSLKIDLPADFNEEFRRGLEVIEQYLAGDTYDSDYEDD